MWNFTLIRLISIVTSWCNFITIEIAIPHYGFDSFDISFLTCAERLRNI